MIAQHLLVDVKGSIGVHRLWDRPYFSSSVSHVLFVKFGWFSRWVVGGRTAAVLWDLFSIARSILLQLPSSFFSICFLASMWCIRTVVLTRLLLGNKLPFILSVRSDFHMTDNLSIAIHAFASHVLMSFSVDETLFPKVNLATSYREPLFSVEMSNINSVLSVFTWRSMPPASRSRLCSRYSVRAGVFTWIAMSLA